MTIDLTGIATKAAFHRTMKSQLGFPDWYGVSWDAFWDAIIAVSKCRIPWCCGTGKPSPRPVPTTWPSCATSSPTTPTKSPANSSYSLCR